MIDLDKVLTWDYETYYDSKYSLRSKEYNTSSYIRDEKFIAHCVGIKKGRAPAEVFWYDDIRPALEAIDWTKWHVLGQNNAFDALISSHHYGIVIPTDAAPSSLVRPGAYEHYKTEGKLYLDTLSMARALCNNSTRMDLGTLLKYFGLPIRKIEGVLASMRGVQFLPPGPERDKATEYCSVDVEGTFMLFEHIVGVFPELELQLIDLTMRMFCDPVLHVDLALATRELEMEIKRKKDLIDLTGLDETELQSAAKFAAQLRAAGVEPPTKISPRTKLEAYAFAKTDEDFIILGAHENPVVRNLVAARLAAKSTIGETRAQRFLTAGANGGTLPIMLNYCGAHTTRWSGGNKMNPQNLPRSDFLNGVYVEDSANLRRSILAPEGHAIVVADSRQIEPRVLGWLAGQWDLLHAFATGADAYIEQAKFIYKTEEISKDQRAVGKAAVLGCGYYMGPPRFQGTLALGILGPKMDLSLEECQAAVWGYRKKNSQIVALWRDMDMVLLRMLTKKTSGNPDELTTYKVLQYDSQTIWLPNGLGLHYPDLTAEFDEERGKFANFSYRSNNEYVRIHSGVLTENLIQALARIIVAEQMLEINKRYRVVMMSHDEVAAIAPVDEADACLEYMLECMRKPLSWCQKLPLDAEGGYDVCYSK